MPQPLRFGDCTFYRLTRVASHANGLVEPVLSRVHGSHMDARLCGNLACDAPRDCDCRVDLTVLRDLEGLLGPASLEAPDRTGNSLEILNIERIRYYREARNGRSLCVSDAYRSNLSYLWDRTPLRERPAEFRPHRRQQLSRVRGRTPRPDAPGERGSREVCGRRPTVACDNKNCHEARCAAWTLDVEPWVASWRGFDIARTAEVPKPHHTA